MRCQGAISGVCGSVGPRNPKTHMDVYCEHSGLLAAAPGKIHAQVRGVEKGPSPAPPTGIYHKGVFSNTPKKLNPYQQLSEEETRVEKRGQTGYRCLYCETEQSFTRRLEAIMKGSGVSS